MTGNPIIAPLNVEEVANITDLEAAKEIITKLSEQMKENSEDAGLAAEDWEAKLTTCEKELETQVEAYKTLKNNLTAKLEAQFAERTSKLVDPLTYRKGWTEPSKYKSVKEKVTKLEAKLQNLKNNAEQEKQEAIKHFKELYEAEKTKNDNHVCSTTDDSVLQDQLTAWDKAFDGRTAQEAKEYWDLDGENMQGIINHYKETNERLLKESTTHKTMYTELRPTLARANFKIEELEDKLAKYEPHDDSWVSQVQIPHKS